MELIYHKPIKNTEPIGIQKNHSTRWCIQNSFPCSITKTFVPIGNPFDSLGHQNSSDEFVQIADWCCALCRKEMELYKMTWIIWVHQEVVFYHHGMSWTCGISKSVSDSIILSDLDQFDWLSSEESTSKKTLSIDMIRLFSLFRTIAVTYSSCRSLASTHCDWDYFR